MTTGKRFPVNPSRKRNAFGTTREHDGKREFWHWPRGAILSHLPGARRLARRRVARRKLAISMETLPILHWPQAGGKPGHLGRGASAAERES